MKNQLLLVVILGIFLSAAGCGESPNTSKDITVSTRIAVQTLPWGSDSRSGKQLVSEHYRIFMTANGTLQRSLPGFLEASYDNYLRITQLPNMPLPKKMPVYMMATRSQWAALSDKKFGMKNSPSLVISNGGYSYMGINVCWNIGGNATYNVAAHEGMHQFLYHRLKNKLPLWAEEGLATTAEGFVMGRGVVTFTPDQNLSRLGNLHYSIVNGLWLPMEELLTTDTRKMAARGNHQVLGYYSQLYALTSFLRQSKTYGPGWFRMFTDAQAGKLKSVRPPASWKRSGKYRYPGIFANYITRNFDAFEKAYLNYARKMVHLPAN
ncbi:MAG: hypothetical protein KAR11_00430 [Phycisphaerae bacterium]|nr:hypothetical protein [Phycisphaerae bacterium]